MATRDQTIDVAIGDGHIAGTLIMPGTRIPGVLFVHGWGGSQQQYLSRAREVAALGCVCLTFDLRGHADTRAQYETVSREQNLADVVAAYDVLLGHPNVDSSAIAVVGSSTAVTSPPFSRPCAASNGWRCVHRRCISIAAGSCPCANCTATISSSH